MTASAKRFSTYTAVSGGSEGKNGEPKNLWTSMLDSVASGKRLPEKNIIVLGMSNASWLIRLVKSNREIGGTTDSQRDFLDSLSQNDRRTLDRQTAKIPPVANSFALGYTYYDVLDTDQEGELPGSYCRFA
jgi:dynein light intermediate chain 1, cytosolic